MNSHIVKQQHLQKPLDGGGAMEMGELKFKQMSKTLNIAARGSEKTFRSRVAVHVKLEFRQSKYGLRY